MRMSDGALRLGAIVGKLRCSREVTDATTVGVGDPRRLGLVPALHADFLLPGRHARWERERGRHVRAAFQDEVVAIKGIGGCRRNFGFEIDSGNHTTIDTDENKHMLEILVVLSHVPNGEPSCDTLIRLSG